MVDMRDPIERQAVRILFILYFCSDSQDEQIPMFEDYTRYVDSELKLQKLDFWIRYPDHLAAALIHGCQTGEHLVERSEEVKRVVRDIVNNQEPRLRWVPMRKYLRGAYEPLDELMCFLTSRWLAYRRMIEKKHRTCYYLTRKGHDTIELMLQECHETLWYAGRCQLINSFYGHLNGFELRNIQYLVDEYANTRYRQFISSIEEKVCQQFDAVFGEPL